MVKAEIVLAPYYRNEVDAYMGKIEDGYQIMNYTYDNDGVVTVNLAKSEADKIAQDMRMVMSKKIATYKDEGKVNNIEFTESGQMLNIDYSKDCPREEYARILGVFVDAATLLQAFNMIPADQYGISLTIKMNGEDFRHEVINKDYLEAM